MFIGMGVGRKSTVSRENHVHNIGSLLRIASDESYFRAFRQRRTHSPLHIARPDLKCFTSLCLHALTSDENCKSQRSGYREYFHGARLLRERA